MPQLVTRRIEALAPAVRRGLEAASVVGATFAVPAVAAGLEAAEAEVEAICAGPAAQKHMITDSGLCVWPDGTRGGSYRFRHGLYQQVLYEQVGATWQAQLHGRIGARLVVGYGAQAGEMAATLARHAERGGRTAAGGAVSPASRCAGSAVPCLSRSGGVSAQSVDAAGDAPG